MKKLVWLVVLLVATGGRLCMAQSKTLNGVYAGVQLLISPIPGSGMDRRDNVILFHPNGTYNDQLDKPDWKTRVTGKYIISGNSVTLTDSKGGKDEYKFIKGGDMDAGSFNMLRQETADRIPPGFFEFKAGRSMGGVGTGMTYVGTMGQKGLNFDGKGNFSTSSSSATVVAGDNIGGGSNSKKSGNGTYKINGGLLTLTFSDGRAETHSFFCRANDNPVMAAIDGDIYFMKDKKELEANKKPAKASAAVTKDVKAGNNTSDATNTGAADGKTLLLKANAAHGGLKLDAVNNVKLTATTMGVQVTTLMDVPAGKMRVEVRRSGTLLSVEQLDGDGGWQWMKGKKSALAGARLAEMKNSFYSGLMGLRKQVLKEMQVTSTQEKQGNYSIVCRRDGVDHIFIINNKGQLVAAGDKLNGKVNTSVFGDIRAVNGVMVPFYEIISAGTQKMNVLYNSFEINTLPNASAWDVPQ